MHAGFAFALTHICLCVFVCSSRLQGPLPTFCGSPLIDLALFDSNLVTAFPDLRCYQGMSQLYLHSNPVRGQLPLDLWQKMPALSSFVISQTFLNGPNHVPSKLSIVVRVALWLTRA